MILRRICHFAAVAFLASTCHTLPSEAASETPASLASPSSAHEPDSPAPDEEARACPEEMVLVDGDYCPNVVHVCTRWMDPPGPFGMIRCAEYKQSPRCEGAREHRRFCIDREEYVRPGDLLPKVHVSWTQAKDTCITLGKRLCKEAEWQFACEGEQMLPYPYGFARDSTACHIDQTKLGRPEEGLNDLRVPLSDFPRCVSPFGIHNMTGNVDEWTEREGQASPNRGALRGGWWLPGRNRCRAATLGHTEDYGGPQVGFRCCKDASDAP